MIMTTTNEVDISTVEEANTNMRNSPTTTIGSQNTTTAGITIKEADMTTISKVATQLISITKATKV